MVYLVTVKIVDKNVQGGVKKLIWGHKICKIPGIKYPTVHKFTKTLSMPSWIITRKFTRGKLINYEWGIQITNLFSFAFNFACHHLTGRPATEVTDFLACSDLFGTAWHPYISIFLNPHQKKERTSFFWMVNVFSFCVEISSNCVVYGEYDWMKEKWNSLVWRYIHGWFKNEWQNGV